MRALVVEADSSCGAGIAAALTGGGFAVDRVADAVRARFALGMEPYELVIADSAAPPSPGANLVRSLRARSEAPLLVVGQRAAPARPCVELLDAGADDYMEKPLYPDELLARARAILRRHAGRSDPGIICGALTLDAACRRASFRNAAVNLTAREFALLEALMARPGTVVSRSRLEQALYGWDANLGSNAIEVHVHHLRRKLSPALIRTVRGAGYRIEPVS